MDLFRSVLWIHILFGTVALLIAPLAMVTVKGGRWHRRWGKIYFRAMAGVAVTALVMCYLRSGVFLFLVAIFSFYLALTGYLVLGRKKPSDAPGILDWIAAIALVIAAAALLVTGALSIGKDEQAWVRIAFGTLGALLGGSDIASFLRKPSAKRSSRAWMYSHMTRFLAAYVATVTAFSVVNFLFLPYLVRWLWPTAVGIGGIAAWRRYYKRKFRENKPVVAEVPAVMQE